MLPGNLQGHSKDRRGAKVLPQAPPGSPFGTSGTTPGRSKNNVFPKETCFSRNSIISNGKHTAISIASRTLDKIRITIGSFLAYRFGLRICMGGDFFEKVWNSEEKYVEKCSFGAELGLGGSVWGIRG